LSWLLAFRRVRSVGSVNDIFDSAVWLHWMPIAFGAWNFFRDAEFFGISLGDSDFSYALWAMPLAAPICACLVEYRAFVSVVGKADLIFT